MDAHTIVATATWVSPTRWAVECSQSPNQKQWNAVSLKTTKLCDSDRDPSVDAQSILMRDPRWRQLRRQLNGSLLSCIAHQISKRMPDLQ